MKKKKKNRWNPPPSSGTDKRVPLKHAFIKQLSLGANIEDAPVLIDPADKAKLTMGNWDTGRISLRQIEFLVSHGYDGDAVRKWTHYHAGTEIERKFGKETRRRVEALPPQPERPRVPAVPTHIGARSAPPTKPALAPPRQQIYPASANSLAEFIALVRFTWTSLSRKQQDALFQTIRSYSHGFGAKP